MSNKLSREEYKAEDLISIKTPITLPYYSNSKTYEAVEGTIVIDGLEYKYVKRRVFNDSLELLCYPNTGKQKLQTAKVNFFKITNEGTSSEQNKKAAGPIKNIIPDYCQSLLTFSFQKNEAAPNSYSTSFIQPFSSLTLSVQEQPPDALGLPA